MEEAEALGERLGFPTPDVPYEEKILPPHRLYRHSMRTRPKMHRRKTADEQKIICQYEDDRNGVNIAEFELAKRSLDQIFDMLQYASENPVRGTK